MKYATVTEPTRCNNDLLIYKISSTCFRQYFAHHQERETEILTAYGILLLWWAGRWDTLPLTDSLPTTTTGYHMLYKSQSHAPDDGQKIA